MRDLLFGSTREQTAALRAASRAAAQAFVAEQRALVGLFQAANPERREFVSGEVACVLHLSPATGDARLAQALRVLGLPHLVAALEDGALGVPHALALLSEVEHLEAPHAAATVAAVLDGPTDADGSLDATPSQLRAQARRAAITLDPELARRRHEAARRTAGARMRPQPDGMADLVLGCTATQAAKVLAALRRRAAAMTFTEDLTEGQKQVAALMHALTCDRVRVQAVIECPVEQSLDLHAAAGAGVWTVHVRVPAAVAMGLADRARAQRTALVGMATSGGTVPDLAGDGYVPSAALGRLVDLRDVTSVFPGDSTPARRAERDHRLPWPLGRTDAPNLQNVQKRWHRAKHEGGWKTRLLPDSTVRWRSPGGGTYDRRPERTVPPPLAPGTTLPPLPTGADDS